MSRPKKLKNPKELASPFSVLLFQDDLKKIEISADKSGIAKSVLLRLLVREAIQGGTLGAMVHV